MSRSNTILRQNAFISKLDMTYTVLIPTDFQHMPKARFLCDIVNVACIQEVHW